ncbi:MAG: serine aminopeptidase domain-containing protein [Gemmataceae bacterium]
MFRTIVTLVTVSFASTANAQVTRYDLGRKLVALEKAWDDHTGAEARKRALPPLKKVMKAFFSGHSDEVAQLFDEARHALESDKPVPDAVRWADATKLRFEKRVFDAAEKSISVQLFRLYDSSARLPTGLQLRLKLLNGDGKSITESIAPIPGLPNLFVLQVPPNTSGDFHLRGEILENDRVTSSMDYGISFVPNVEARVKSLDERADLRKPVTTEDFTLRSHVSLLVRGFAREETNYPVNRLLDETEALARLPNDGTYFDKSRPGQFWMTLATAKGPAPIRIQVPKFAADAKPVPLVIAMHGAGGSENLFFEGYGHGEIVRLCEKRGWLLVATRTEGIAAAPVAAIVDELAKRYPVDQKRVFVIGHSMGAAQVMSLARYWPNRWRGLVCLGGGGALAEPAKVKHIPFFVGVGSEDFALTGARSLAKSLQEVGAEQVKFIEYPDVEHIMVVQVALPDIFKWLDELAK